MRNAASRPFTLIPTILTQIAKEKQEGERARLAEIQAIKLAGAEKERKAKQREKVIEGHYGGRAGRKAGRV
jgi:hypothetical protein